jgi:2-polyprenyl-3-methyl-5-hydroxy-6-metoxy-1,4-benzoquinol methylase
MDANIRRSALLVRHSDQSRLKREGVSREIYAQIYRGQAPWEVGQPQPAIVALEAAGKFRGAVLDVGCGTGEISLFLASRGHEVVGIDFVEEVVLQARDKASRHGVQVRFEVHDALELAALGWPCDTVVDSATFHAFSDAHRARYAQVLRTAMKPGGILHLLCISDQEPYSGGPRHVSQQEIRDSFTDGWDVASIQETRYLATIAPDGGARAWLAEIHRL